MNTVDLLMIVINTSGCFDCKDYTCDYLFYNIKWPLRQSSVFIWVSTKPLSDILR